MKHTNETVVDSALIKAQAARIERLESQLATARNDALREAACWVAGLDREIEKLVLALITKEKS